MGGPLSEAEFHFLELGTTTFIDARQATVGDVILFQVYPGCRPGGPPIPMFAPSLTPNLTTITSMTCRVERDGAGFLLKAIKVDFHNLGGDSSNILPFDIRIRTDDPNGILTVSSAWSALTAGEHTLTEIDFFTAWKSGSADIVAELVLPSGVIDPAVSKRLSVQVAPYSLHVAVPATKYVPVGGTIGPPLSIAVPFADDFSTSAPFWAGLELAEDRRSLTITNLARPPLAIGAFATFHLQLSVAPDADGWNDVFFQKPEPAELSLLESMRFESFDNYIVGRKAGTCRIVCTIIVNDPDRFAAPAVPAAFDVVVQPQTLTLEVGVGGGGSAVVLEDDWRADEGKLRGSVHIRVLRGTGVLFDSRTTSVVQGTYDAKSLSVLRIDRRYDDGEERATDRFNTSVQLRLRITPSEFAVFDVPGYVPGSFEVNNPAWDWLAAARHTVSATPVSLTCELVPVNISRPSDYPPDFVVYQVPEPKTLGIVIPPPLRGELVAWNDAHFTGLALDAGNPDEELIYASGTLDARVREHRPESSSEDIKIVITTPDGTIVETPLDATVDLTAAGDLHAPTGGFAYSAADGGVNTLTLWAWKPINDVENVPPDSATVQLRCVPPSDLAILEPVDGLTVRRARLENVRYRLARALGARIVDINTVRHSDDGKAYDSATRNSGPIDLSSTSGDHQLILRAINDFDTVESRITLHAPRPTLQVTIQRPEAWRDPDEVGHSVKSVDVAVTVTNGLRLQVRRGATELADNALNAGVPSQTVTLRLPPSGDLTVGDNTFEVTATNDFGSRSQNVTIRRRDRVFDGSATFSIEAVPSLVEGSVVIVEIVARVNGATLPVVSEPEMAAFTVDGPADDPHLDWEEFNVTTFISTEDGIRFVAVNLVHRVGAFIIGPDFQNVTILIEPDPASIVSGGEANESAIAGLFSTVTLRPEAASGGDDFIPYPAVNLDTLQVIDSEGNPV